MNILNGSRNKRQRSKKDMKYKKSIALVGCLLTITFLSGCSGGSGGGNNSSSGPAASSLANHTISVSVSSGTAPFSTGGSYVFTPAGDGTSGSYQLVGQGGVQSNNGTYTYTKTGDSTASLVETEEINGTVVDNTLTFQTANSGTIHSSSPNKGGTQDGTFTLN
jgi:hypothetical protein